MDPAATRRRLGAAGIALSILLAGCTSSGSEETRAECGFLGIEAATFDTWRDLANRGLAAPAIAGYGYATVRVDLGGGLSLEGYRLSATPRERAPRAVLFLQGNAMRADQLRHKLTFFADRGYDVLVFDYRGYGRSDGEPLLRPISLDQARVADFVGNEGYGAVYLYGISLGGILAMGPYMPRERFKAIAIDSSPAKLPWYSFCPDVYDPIANLPADASNMLVISGGEDRVVEAEDVAPLGDAVRQAGGRYLHEPAFGHPLADGAANTQRRFAAVADFFDSRP